MRNLFAAPNLFQQHSADDDNLPREALVKR